ncbi:uncharacterized protein C8Q71DRAFT_732336 [Rhodofomes roseus]|uniref:RRM domain-containing protein n=1 Tax=Rhodofomes roseus TaxID=34475 RepID=A0ABQ8KYI2_9APHY|nr:uncharacterized protein C8Q71DRAFT_732336 [Rhodofomes roseus]KAH9844369.1 hypothetical protein C8Q71DRAFT_732336 [Rhodofomes roseus]
MNVVREINKINERELEMGATGSWHDDYKDSAYIFIGGLHSDLTEGDAITIFSQYGEVMDVNLPRDKNTGKTRGFGFLMYEDQRSTILAVDNLNGAKVLDRTLRVDHVKNYKQPKMKGEDGEWQDGEEQSLNAKPELVVEGGDESESSEDDGPPIDPEDPMYEYLVAKRKEERAAKKSKKGKSKSKAKHKDETPEERRARKARKRLRKGMGKSEGVKAVKELLASFQDRQGSREDRMNSRSPPRTPPRERDEDGYGRRHPPAGRRSVSRDRSHVRDDHDSRRRYSRSPLRRDRDADDRRGRGRYDEMGRTPPRRQRDYD